MRWPLKTPRAGSASDGRRALYLVLLVLACCAACAARFGSDETPAAAGAPAAGYPASSGRSGSEAVAGMNSRGGSATSAGAGSNAGAGAGSSAGAGSNAGTGSNAGATSGSGGAAGRPAVDMAGSSGTAAASSVAECRTDRDCEVSQDCCTCQAVPSGAPMPACPANCGSNACEIKGISAVAKCTLGRCRLATSCNERQATCKSVPLPCPAGEVRSVTELGCWGACLAPTECADVSDCAACEDALCVKFPNIGGTTFHCVARQAACETGNLCDCLLPCGPFGCAEQSSEIGCFCAGCAG